MQRLHLVWQRLQFDELRLHALDHVFLLVDLLLKDVLMLSADEARETASRSVACCCCCCSLSCFSSACCCSFATASSSRGLPASLMVCCCSYSLRKRSCSTGSRLIRAILIRAELSKPPGRKTLLATPSGSGEILGRSKSDCDQLLAPPLMVQRCTVLRTIGRVPEKGSYSFLKPASSGSTARCGTAAISASSDSLCPSARGAAAWYETPEVQQQAALQRPAQRTQRAPRGHKGR